MNKWVFNFSQIPKDLEGKFDFNHYHMQESCIVCLFCKFISSAVIIKPLVI